MVEAALARGPVDHRLPAGGDRRSAARPGGRRRDAAVTEATLPSRAGRITCLLVDDLDENLLVLSALLEPLEVEILTARSGAEALDVLLSHDVALVLLDVHMPEMDGFELAEIMRGAERTRHIPLIFVTAGRPRGAAPLQGLRPRRRRLPLQADRRARAPQQGARVLRAAPPEAAAGAAAARAHRDAAAERDVRRDARPRPARRRSTSSSPRRTCSSGSPTTPRRCGARRGQMRASGVRMARMIADMLDLARGRLGGGIPIQRAADRSGGARPARGGRVPGGAAADARSSSTPPAS